jgi:GNAT superfamily N-acetyltransferase
MKSLTHSLKKITFEEIYPIWRDYLWPNRISPIETNSAMLCTTTGEKKYDMKNMNTKPTFFGYYINNELVGVNSGHMCGDNTYRSRGLYVLEKYRRMRIGTRLLLATIAQSKKEGADMCWSYPRDTSWNTYFISGFVLCSDFVEDENGKNAYCVHRY